MVGPSTAEMSRFFCPDTLELMGRYTGTHTRVMPVDLLCTERM